MAITRSSPEASTCTLIDQQLRDAGWEADTKALRFPDGARPQKGKSLAIAEWPTEARPMLVSDHEDELARVEHGYGKGKKPKDYLTEFE